MEVLPVPDAVPALEVLSSSGNDALARVFVVRVPSGAVVECVESVQPPIPRERKWVLIVSTMAGCPVRCPICDAGGGPGTRLSAVDILAQVSFLVRRRNPDGRARTDRLKVQFARMGDPALNLAVIEALGALPATVDTPGLVASVSTIAPAGRERFFEDLRAIKEARYGDGRFQMQFSLHTTCEETRRWLVPARTWSFAKMAAWGERFQSPGDQRITLNFAAVRGLPLEPRHLLRWFEPARYLVKLTPINPTAAARRAGLEGRVDPMDPAGSEALADGFRAVGYDALVSIGDLEENRIGSNCGMAVRAWTASRYWDGSRVGTSRCRPPGP